MRGRHSRKSDCNPPGCDPNGILQMPGFEWAWAAILVHSRGEFFPEKTGTDSSFLDGPTRAMPKVVRALFQGRRTKRNCVEKRQWHRELLEGPYEVSMREQKGRHTFQRLRRS